MFKLFNLGKAGVEKTGSNQNIKDPYTARKYLIKVFNEMGLEFINARKNAASYALVVIKCKDVKFDNSENSLFKKAIIEQLEDKKCCRDLLKIHVPISYEHKRETVTDSVLCSNNEKDTAVGFDALLASAIDTVVHGVD